METKQCDKSTKGYMAEIVKIYDFSHEKERKTNGFTLRQRRRRRRWCRRRRWPVLMSAMASALSADLCVASKSANFFPPFFGF